MNWTALISRVPEWRSILELAEARFSKTYHGDFDRWQAAVDALPEIEVTGRDLGDTVTTSGNVDSSSARTLRAALLELHPWRKGPFNLFGVEIDCEWRSDWKWQRVAPHVGSLRGASILDVGCGNGYFGWRMLQGGAASVVGVDPTLLYCMQHRAINTYLNDERNWVLPLKFEELPDAEFDLTFSMGVVYHRRDPAAHVQRLFELTRPGGSVVLESLVVRTESSLEPAGRYARMANVHVVPSLRCLRRWLHDAGFDGVRLVDVGPTTTREQRSTPWMRFESLAEALDPEDPSQTVEGHPAPTRAVAVADRPDHGKPAQKRVRSLQS